MIITPGASTAALISALLAPGTGLAINSLTISGQSSGSTASWGTYTNASGVYGIGDGIIISTGKARDFADGAMSSGNGDRGTNFGTTATPAQQTTCDIANGSAGSGVVYYDVTEIDIVFTLDGDHDTVSFQVVFGTQEYPFFVNAGSLFNDVFGLFVNGENIANVNLDVPINGGSWTSSFGGNVSVQTYGINNPTAGGGLFLPGVLGTITGCVPSGFNATNVSCMQPGGFFNFTGPNPGAFSSGGSINANVPINLLNPAMLPPWTDPGLRTPPDPTPWPRVTGTRLHGVIAPGGNPVLSFSKKVGAGATGTLQFIIADAGDNIYDTTAYFNGLSGGSSVSSPFILANPYGFSAGQFRKPRRMGLKPTS